MTNLQITGVLIDLVGANLRAHQAIAEIVAKMPAEQQGKVATILQEAIASNQEALEAIKKGLRENG